jgi:glycosyltransferase involved in cell wall biosynthesis
LCSFDFYWRRPLANFSTTELRCLAILGRRDEPTDGVEEYCHYLSEGLAAERITLELFRLRWTETGWAKSVRGLGERMAGAEYGWVVVQYTALGWSRKGFPARALRLLKLLKKKGVRCAVVFHDAGDYSGPRWRDRVRRRVQLFVMRECLRLSDLAIVTVPREKLSWVPVTAKNAVFIPVGANLPAPEKAWAQKRDSSSPMVPAVAVFTITDGAAGEREAGWIAEAMKYATGKMGRLRLILLGRNSETGGAKLRELLKHENVEVEVRGLLPGEGLVQKLGEADAMLFVRAPISSRRGSALAGIACGLPVIGREGAETGAPITEAGVVLLPEDSTSEYGAALVRVLSDGSYRASLAERSRAAQERYFSWQAIARAYGEALRGENRVEVRDSAQNQSGV